MASPNAKLAVLIDAENVSPKTIPNLMQEIAKYGTVHAMHVYADWTIPAMNSWKAGLSKHAFTPIQQFTYDSHKNATDGSMIIGAMDLLFKKHFDTFCIVAGGSDLSRLVTRIREEGTVVYGFGMPTQTNQTFIAACDKFTELETSQSGGKVKKTKSAKSKKNESTSLTAEGENVSDAEHAVVPQSFAINRTNTNPTGIGDSDNKSGPVIKQEFEPESNPTITRPFHTQALKDLKKAMRQTQHFGEGRWRNVAAVGFLMDKYPRFRTDYRIYGYERFEDFLYASGLVTMKTLTTANQGPVLVAKLKASGR